MMCLLNFMLVILLWRTRQRGPSSSTARLEMGYILFPLLNNFPNLFKASFATMSLLKYGTIVLAIHHIALFNKFYPSTTFQSPPIRHLLLASLVNKAKAIDFHLVLPSPSLLFLLELIFSDVWGPSPVVSTSGNKYYVSFVDHYSRYVWLFPISNKSDVLSIFCAFQNMVERMFDRKIIAVQIDWGSEFRSLHKFFVTKGIDRKSVV